MSINQKKLSDWATVILLVLIVWVWAQVFLGQKAGGRQDLQNGVRVAGSSPILVNRKPVSEFHIFGSPEVLTEMPLSAGHSSLQLTLNGTIASDNSSDSKLGLAYITNQQGVQKKFKVGEKIFDLATLKEIHSDHVVISRAGKREKIVLSDTRNIASTNNKSSNSAKTEAQKAAKKSNYLKHLNGPQNQNWQQTMNQQNFDPSKISSIVSNVNIMTNQAGQIKGLRVSNLAQDSVLTKLGLKSSDIITAVNGQAVSGTNMLSIRQTLEKNPNANVTIRRNGRVQNIQVNLTDL